ncbi:SlyX family protein [Thalassotalea maritima]|uniref:SlyX family protein n=1 Tax=Thalassotalea maritima TaxID=3242416 RepID=UPI0035281D70
MSTEQALIEQLQNRIDNLEAKVAFQDDVIEKLNVEITFHQDNLRQLNDQMRLVIDKVKSMNVSTIARQEDETPPPHY